MAAYYHSHHHHHHNNPDIQDHNNTNTNTNNTNNFHTLLLMNQNLTDPHHHHHHHHHQPPPPPQSHNILLLNSAAASVAAGLSSPPPPLLPHQHHHFVRLPTSPPQPNNITLYGYPSHEAREPPRARQGLSLSLSSQNPAILSGSHHGGDADVADGGQGFVLGSKYLKAAQELLEEVVHVGDDGGFNFKGGSSNNTTDNNSPKKGGNTVVDAAEEEKEKLGGGGSGGGGQLSTAERQEIQMKKAKLVTMLEEAEQRYRQYNQQMQIVIESFEQAAGMGSAKTYTSLALKTISKQFRCLKDAIQGQIRAANKSLGDEQEGGSGSLIGGKIEGSRLKYIDHQIRQQRALQQLGMIQNPTAWRPQRGLPERSVSVLRAWLFEHFLHPYPKDSDKILLAKQTGLTRSQVSNWFINARVRLWKPMIEEMYMEEIKEQEQNNGLSEDKIIAGINNKENNNNDDNGSGMNAIDNNQDKVNISEDIQIKNNNDHNNGGTGGGNGNSSFIPIPTNTLTPFKGGISQHGFTLTNSLEMEGGISQRSPKRHRNEEVIGYEGGNNGEFLIKFGNEKQERENNENGYPIISGGMNFIGGGDLGMGTYPIGEIGRFETEDFTTPTQRFLQGNGISLSLGLPPSCENHSQNGLDNHTFMGPNPNIQFRRPNEFGAINNSPVHSSNAAFECIDIQNRKNFAAQLLPDFVA